MERTRPRRSPPASIAAIATLAVIAAASCGDGTPSSGAGVVRDTTASGAVRVRYPVLPQGPVDTLAPTLRLGTAGDDVNLSFGDVRSVDAASDGTIFVLDTQSSEIRAFSPDGRYLRTLTRRGEGPGEISESNGILLRGDSLIWVQDYRKWMMIALDLTGEEVARRPMPVRSYGYVWDGTVDRRGRHLKLAEHSDTPPAFPPEIGLTTGTFQRYLVRAGADPSRIDSVYVGPVARRAWVSESGNGGWSFRQIPYDPQPAVVIDPDGGFWEGDPAAYRFVHRDERGDTTLVVESATPPLPVTVGDREAWIEGQSAAGPEAARAAQAAAAFIPESKPAIARLLVDDARRVWVRRIVEDGELPLYDVFDAEGTYLGSLRLGFEPRRGLPIRIRNGRIYAVVSDELDVPYVYRAPVPDLATPVRLR